MLLLAGAACAPRMSTMPAGAWSEAEWQARFADADTLRTALLAPGVRHAYLWLAAGPWAVHVIEIDGRACRADIVAAKAGPPVQALATTTALGSEAVAAINADFFQAPGGTPVGAHVTGGRVLVGPGARPLYALTADGAQWAGPGALRGAARAGADSIEIVQVNRPVAGGRHQPPLPGLTLFDDWFGEATPPDSGSVTLRVRRFASEAGGENGAGVVVAVEAPGAGAALDSVHAAFHAVGTAAAAWIDRRQDGDTVYWQVAVQPADSPADRARAHEAVGAFPMLVQHGRGVTGDQPGVIDSFGPVRHPRTAVGWNAATARTVWVVVDGRNAPYSDGMSLAELEWLLLRLGAADAINLDGGGSTALAVAGRLVNRPTDDDGERPVANALVLRRCR